MCNPPLVGKSHDQSGARALRINPARVLIYAGLGLAIVTLWSQMASPHMPTARAFVIERDPAGLLPPLPINAVVPDQPAPAEALFEITLGYPADGDIARLLVQAGASEIQAKQSAEMLREEFGGTIDDVSDIKLALGEKVNGQGRSIEQLTILNDLGRTVITRAGMTLRLEQGTPQTLQVEVSAGSADALQSLRSAGLDARLALEASTVLERRAADALRVTAVIAERPDRFDGRSTPQLLYLSATRAGGRPVQLLRWPGTPEGWIDVEKFSSGSSFMQPVHGPISSRFGTRLHPILRFLRPHQGVDYAASRGTPVRAAADGRVIGAGWSGGYGRQVRLDHGNAVVTSYSHLSRMVAFPGRMVRRGQVVGYVGATGLATGPHLHFEILRMGRRIDPLGAHLIEGNAVDRAAIVARLAQLRIAGA